MDTDLSFLRINNMKEPKTLEELTRQIGQISNAMDKCERMLQQMAAAGYAEGSGEDIMLYASHQMRLASQKSHLEKLKVQMESGQSAEKIGGGPDMDTKISDLGR